MTRQDKTPPVAEAFRLRGAGMAAIGTLTLLVLTIHCARQASEPKTPPHILFVSIDTLRADHLGCYGYERDTSPVIDALAHESVRFTTALAPTPWTFPSHAAMLTGMHPYALGIDNSLRTIPREVPVLAEVLARGGYQTAAFVDSQPRGFVGGERGFSRGFERYEHAPHREGLALRFDVAATVDAALAWLRGRDTSRPFFLFLHTKSVHAVPNDAECQDERCFPYDNPHRFRFVASEDAPFAWTSPEDGAGQRYLWSQNAKILDGEPPDPSSYSPERLEVLEALYDSGIFYVDLELGRLLDELRAQGLYEETVVVVTADHGEAFLDHNLFMHQEVYDPLIRVPLIMRLPRSPGSAGGHTVDSEVLLEDVAPTLLELAGAGVPEIWTGRQLPLDGGDVEPRDALSYYLFPSKFAYQSLALRRGEWKLVVHNVESPESFRTELYNLASDPDERRPVQGMDERRETLRQELRRRLRQAPLAQGAQLREEELPNLEAIRALGYIE